MRKPATEQEVVILGEGMGGLVAGTLLAKKNLPVILIKEKEEQSFCDIQGYHFTPFSNFSEKLFKPGLIRKLSQMLNLPIRKGDLEEGGQAKNAPERAKPKGYAQVILPKSRIDLYYERFLFKKEWKREFPQEVESIETFYNEMDRIQRLLQQVSEKQNLSPFFPFPQHSFIKKIFASGTYPKENLEAILSFFSKEFQEFIRLQMMASGNLHSNRTPMTFVSHHLAGETDEPFHLERLKKEILNQFRHFGGRVEEVDQIKKIHSGWRRGITINSEGDLKAFQPQWLILNTPLHRLSASIGERGVRWGKRVKPLYRIVPLFLGIREEVVPVGMKDMLISLSDLEKSYDGGNLLFISLSQKGDETRAPTGKRALTVEYLIDAKQRDAGSSGEAPEGVMKHLHTLLPFLEQHTEFVEFQWAKNQFSRWSYPHFIYEMSPGVHWMRGAVPLKLFKNVFFVGKENYPFLGLEGEIFSGVKAANQIMKKYS